jgi:GT2 family glycosyltransferase
VVIASFEVSGFEITRQCLKSIQNQDKELKVYLSIIDTDTQSITECKKDFHDVTLVILRGNLGFSYAVNEGIKKSIADHYESFFILNNDTVLDKKCLSGILKSEHASLNSLISPKIYFAKGEEYHKDRYLEKEKGRIIWYAGGKMDWDNILASHRGVDEVDHGQYDKTILTDFVTGCCMYFKKKVIDDIGLFDEKYFLYYEDLDFSVRAARAHYSLVYYPGSYLWHKNAVSSGRPGSLLHQYYQTRNRLYFGYKYATLRTKAALFRESLKNLSKGSVVKKGALDYYLSHMGRQDFS